MKDMKGILFLLTLAFLCVDFLPHYIYDFHMESMELTESDEHKSESGEKEKELEDLKDYTFTNINVANRSLLNSQVIAIKDFAIFNHHYMDVFTPPPEHYMYPAC
jgi:hypothetical protein